MQKCYINPIASAKKASTYLLYALLLQAISAGLASAQTNTVTGKVTSSDGGLPGVNILEKGTNNAAITDTDGQYSIRVPKDAELVFSYVGFLTEYVKVSGRSEIDVELSPDVKSLGEVVVVGYGAQEKKTVTGSIVTVQGKTLEQNPAVNLSNSFAGRLPGLQALNRSGEPGNDVAQLLIRGKSTLGSTAPLIVIDGVPGREGFDQIDPRDVESISILKDASASIYGARAANGVIIITTKRGSSGKPSINYSFNQGITTLTRVPDYADSETLARFQNDQLQAQGQNIRYTPDQIQKFRDGSDPLNYPNTDWAKATLKNVSTQSRHSLSVRGGNEIVKYFVSGNYANQEGIFKNGINNYNVLGGRSNIDASISSNLKVSLDLSLQEQNRTFPGVSTADIVKAMWRNYPYLVDFYPNGLPGDGVERGDNPTVMASDKAGYRKSKTDIYQTRLSFDLNIEKVIGLGVDGFVAYDKNSEQIKEFNKPYSVYSYNAQTNTYQQNPARFFSQPQLTERLNYRSNLIGHLKLKYVRGFNNHRINSFVAMELADTRSNYFSAQRRGFISTAIDQLYAGGETNQLTDGSALEFTRKNFFGRINYDFKGKYLVDLNVRYDGSSAFPKDKRWGLFPGISLGWLASSEDFLKNDVVDHLKFRFSWGKMGNDAIDPFQYLSTYSFTNGYFLGDAKSLNKGLNQNVAPNPNITWEVANTTNLGLNAELWNGLLGVTLDVFKTRRSNILTARDASIPIYTGLKLPLENIGIVENKGFEIELSHRKTFGQLNYSIRPNMSFARNKVIDIDEPENVPQWQRRTGYNINSGLYLIPLGIYRTQEAIDGSAHVPNTIVNDLQYKDVNDDGKIDNLDRVRLDKSSTPEIIYGTQISLGYKSFDVGILLQGQSNAWRYYWFPQGLFGNVLQEMADNRPSAENPDSKYPNLTYDAAQVSALTSEFWLKDASFIRLKTVEIGYALPTGLLKKIHLNGVRFYVNGFNIFTLDKLKWFDPEGDADRGSFYPQNRIFNAGFNITL
ncbi:SusC/RagA family TonB-linked outer membrane protein [Dyadobacter bucti]|uniref:SusC/RagA family TonB-linked outer membrane protein n=1 Tax=Dyadobacter bucti TaxID=2572203 RepID=UPI001107E632|nr:TonB-dependent receptor [Dyadobacter bucti]